ncbi:MAG: tetratricopeptide repeat protein [Desulfatiglandales bacterium]
MNRCLWFCACTMAIFLLEQNGPGAAQITIESEEQFAYACTLMEREAYDRAVDEFERFTYFFADDEKVPEARYMMGLCRFRAGQYEAAREICLDLQRDFPTSPIGGKALILMGETYYAQGAFAEADRYFKMVVERFPGLEIKNGALYRLGWSRMQRDQWCEASETFKEVSPESPLFTSAKRLSEESRLGEELPYKVPAAAGVMAGVLPGLGHAYCERYKDGLVALLLNGLFIWAAYESFEQDQEVLGGILTFLELGWYTGNIYSAVNCAHKHNRAVRNKYRQSLLDRFDLSLFSMGGRDLGLALRLEF